MILAFLKILGCLGLLMYGMKLLGEGLQKMAGNQLRHILETLTTNRFRSLLTGAVITAIIQSSSATSVMTVGFVHAGMLTLAQGLSLIMGASIGNTLIAWLMAAEFNFTVSYYIIAFFAVAIVLVNTRNYRSQGESLFGLCLMFLGLRLLYDYSESLEISQSQTLLSFFGYVNEGYFAYFILMLIGGILIFAIQSSAALMASSMILCSTGLLSIESGIALVLGENLGRALLTYKAAWSANFTARRLAIAQLIFNLSGIAWVFGIYPFFTEYLCQIIGYIPGETTDRSLSAYVLAAFHTGYNLLNVTLFIWMIHPLAKITELLVPQKKNEEADGELRYITGGLLATPELSILEAQKEITNFADLTHRMFTQVRFLMNAANNQEFLNLSIRIKKMENSSDKLEEEIARYLGEVGNDLLSSETKNQIRGMLREVSELESIADSCFLISRVMAHKYHGKEQFTVRQHEHLHQLFLLTEQAFEVMKRTFSTRRPAKETHMINFINQEIKNFKKQLRNQNITDINNHEYSYHVGTMYLDIINECENISEYVQNIIEARIESTGI